VVPVRRTQTPLSRERILDAAEAIARAEGVGALSMRRVAAALGTGAMSLYNHVPNKDALLGGLAERVTADVEVPTGSDPRELAASWARSVRRALIANRPLLPVVLARTQRGHLAQLGKVLVEALTGAGMGLADAIDVAAVLGRYVAGALMFDGATRGDVPDEVRCVELDRVFDRGLDALLTGLIP
jgi:AcrR family transcriptional regulator